MKDLCYCRKAHIDWALEQGVGMPAGEPAAAVTFGLASHH